MNIKESEQYYNFHWENFKEISIPDVKIKKAELFFAPIGRLMPSNLKILDVGCGNGVHWTYLNNALTAAFQYFGIDASAEAIAHLNSTIDAPNAVFEVQNACDIQFPDGEFDLVFAYGVLGYTPDPQKAFREMVRVCKKGGLIGVFSPEITGVNKMVLDITRSITAVSSNRGKRILADVLVPFYG